MAASLGFEIPPTLITNSPSAFLEFYRSHDGRVISKRVGASRLSGEHSPFVRYTEVVSTRDVGHAQAVRYCPIMFQAYVPKAVEVRATVVGEEVFTVEIRSQETNHTRHDWRRYDHAHTPYLPHPLPAEEEARCRDLARKLGLSFGAVDLVLTPEGRYVFLEINPNGQYLWVELATGLPITEAICDLLVAGSNFAPAGAAVASVAGGTGA